MVTLGVIFEKKLLLLPRQHDLRVEIKLPMREAGFLGDRVAEISAVYV